MAIEEIRRPKLTDKVRDSAQEIRDLGAELSEIVRDVRALFSKDAELGVAEMKEQASSGMKGAVLGGAAFIFAGIFLVFAFLTMMFALDTAMALWTAALITTLVIAGIAAVLGLIARQYLKRAKFKPERFMRSVQEDISWLKSQTRSSGI